MRIRSTSVLLCFSLGALAWVYGAVADLLPVALLLLLASVLPRLRTLTPAALVLLVFFGSAVLVEHASVAHDRRYWSVPRGPAGGLLYVALGDSAAQGIGASSPERGYVGLLATRMRRATGRPVQVVNLSRSGARVTDVIRTQLPRLRRLHPDVVTVAVGGNDVRSYVAATFARDVATLAAELPPGTAIADVPYFMHGWWERDAAQAAIIVDRSAQRRGLTVVHLHEALRRQGWSAMLTQTAADWFHPNDRGHTVWAQAFWQAMVTAGTLGPGAPNVEPRTVRP